MKKIGIFLFMIFLLAGCKNQVEVSYENRNTYKVFAVEEKTFQIKEIEIEYVIEDIQSIFELYTIYQNHLPIGYISPASPNISLLEWKLSNKDVYLTVDQFIFVSDIPLFKEVLEKTIKLYGYNEIHIIHLLNEL